MSTRARRGSVPAYAIVGSDALCPFDARVLDLQVILEASDVAALERAVSAAGLV